MLGSCGTWRSTSREVTDSGSLFGHSTPVCYFEPYEISLSNPLSSSQTTTCKGVKDSGETDTSKMAFDAVRRNHTHTLFLTHSNSTLSHPQPYRRAYMYAKEIFSLPGSNATHSPPSLTHSQYTRPAQRRQRPWHHHSGTSEERPGRASAGSRQQRARNLRHGEVRARPQPKTPNPNSNPRSHRYFEDGPPFLLEDFGCEPDMPSQKVHEAYEQIEKNRQEFFKGLNAEFKRNKDLPICSVPMADVSFFEVCARYRNPVCRTNFSPEHLPPPCRGLHLSNTGSKTRTFPSTSPTRTKNRPKSSATTTSTT